MTALTREGLIENCLRMLYGPRQHDERLAFEMLGGFGFAAKRKKRRLRLLGIAQEIAARVNHGDEQEPMQIVPHHIVVPVMLEEAARFLMGYISLHPHEVD